MRPVPVGTTEAMDAYTKAQMRRLKIPGAALEIVEGAEIEYQQGYGRVRPGEDAPTPQTPFALGSTTKSFTALPVMQLVETGGSSSTHPSGATCAASGWPIRGPPRG